MRAVKTSALCRSVGITCMVAIFFVIPCCTLVSLIVGEVYGIFAL